MADFRVIVSSGEGGHVEQAADFFSAAGDMGGAGLFSRLAIKGSDARQGGDLMAIEMAQFGQVRQEHGAGLRTDAGRTSEQSIFVLQIIVGLDVVLDEFVEFADLEFEGFDHFADAFTDFNMVDHRGAIGFLGEQVGELSSTGDQFGEGLGLGVRGRFRGRLNHFAEVGQNVGIDGVGLGKGAEATGEVADLARIGDDNVVAGLEEFGGKGLFVAAGGFEDDLGDGEVFQGEDEVAMALTGVEIVALELGGPRGDLKRGFGDVDAEEKRGRHGVLPFLPMRAWPSEGGLAQAAVRVRSTGAARTMLRDGLEDRDTIGLTPPSASHSARGAAPGLGLRFARLAGG
jgi:hypothetical protein